MEYDGEYIQVSAKLRGGRWFWSYRLRDQVHECHDLGLQTEAQAIDEGWHDLRRRVERLNFGSGAPSK